MVPSYSNSDVTKKIPCLGTPNLLPRSNRITEG